MFNGLSQFIREKDSRWNGALTRILRYSLAVFLVGAALIGSLWIETVGMRSGKMPPFLFALALSAWIGGTGPAVLALFLSCAVFDYFLIQPLNSFTMSRQEAPYLIVFALFAGLVRRNQNVDSWRAGRLFSMDCCNAPSRYKRIRCRWERIWRAARL